MKTIITFTKLVAAWVAVAVLAGCAHIARSHSAARQKLELESQALTTAVVDALELQPAPRRDAFSSLALELAREDQRIEGVAPEPIAVEPLLETALETAPADAGAVETQPRRSETSEAREALEARFTRIRGLLAREQAQSRRLERLGAVHEQEQNTRRLRRAGWIGSVTALVAAAVVLLVFVPAAIPLLGRFLGWLVGKIPALASFAGVVSVRAFDAIVRGIERGRPDATRMENAREAMPREAGLEASLAREMDAAHKALVRARKAAIT